MDAAICLFSSLCSSFQCKIYHPLILHGLRDTSPILWGKFGEDLQQEVARLTWSYLASSALLSDTMGAMSTRRDEDPSNL